MGERTRQSFFSVVLGRMDASTYHHCRPRTAVLCMDVENSAQWRRLDTHTIFRPDKHRVQRWAWRQHNGDDWIPHTSFRPDLHDLPSMHKQEAGTIHGTTTAVFLRSGMLCVIVSVLKELSRSPKHFLVM